MGNNSSSILNELLAFKMMQGISEMPLEMMVKLKHKSELRKDIFFQMLMCIYRDEYEQAIQKAQILNQQIQYAKVYFCWARAMKKLGIKKLLRFVKMVQSELYVKIKNHQKVIEHFSKAYEQKNKRKFLIAKIKSLEEIEKFEEALVCCDQAISLKPQKTDVQEMKKKIQEKLKDQQEKKQNLTKKEEPNNK